MASLLPITSKSAQPAEPPVYRIGDLAKRINKSTRAVRLYEEMKLLGEITRNEGGQRIYGEDVFARLIWIEKLQNLGFTLHEIRDLLASWSGNKFGPEGMKYLREVYREKLEETQFQIKQLESLSEELQDSLEYLESCEICDPCTLLGACTDCAHPHSTSAKPTLVAGLYSVADHQSQETK